MVIVNLLVRAGKGIVLEKAVNKLSREYLGLRDSRSSHKESVNGYELRDNRYFHGGRLKDIAERYGLEGMMADYNGSLLDRIQAYLKEVHGLTQYLRDIAQKRIPATDADVYARISSAYARMSDLTGFNIPHLSGKNSYLSDVVNAYLHQIGDVNARLEKFLRMASVFDTGSSAARRTAKFVAMKVLEKKGIPVGSIDSIVAQISKPFADIERQAKPLFAEYNDVVNKFKNAYNSDLFADAYAPLAA